MGDEVTEAREGVSRVYACACRRQKTCGLCVWPSPMDIYHVCIIVQGQGARPLDTHANPRDKRCELRSVARALFLGGLCSFILGTVKMRGRGVVFATCF